MNVQMLYVYDSNHFVFPTVPELEGSDIISSQRGSFLQDEWKSPLQ